MKRYCDCGKEVGEKNKSGLCGKCLTKSNYSVKRMIKTMKGKVYKQASIKNNMDKETLKNIIKELIEVTKETNLKISDEKIFDNACQFLRGKLAGESKEQKKLDPMTEKQHDFIAKNEAELRTLGFDIDNIQNKSDAFKIINEFMKIKEGKNETRRKANPDY